MVNRPKLFAGGIEPIETGSLFQVPRGQLQETCWQAQNRSFLRSCSASANPTIGFSEPLVWSNGSNRPPFTECGYRGRSMVSAVLCQASKTFLFSPLIAPHKPESVSAPPAIRIMLAALEREAHVALFGLEEAAAAYFEETRISPIPVFWLEKIRSRAKAGAQMVASRLGWPPRVGTEINRRITKTSGFEVLRITDPTRDELVEALTITPAARTYRTGIWILTDGVSFMNWAHGTSFCGPEQSDAFRSGRRLRWSKERCDCRSYCGARVPRC